tara:strand:+ start:549 stop:1517 length:969 start_codon:yes stop_codon:yes gene_type:complete
MNHDYRSLGAKAILVEAKAVEALTHHLDETFNVACALMHTCSGRVIVTGMGKSGHIGRKIAATLASTGTPAFFVHPGEASHGDFGMITKDDVLLALSYSGETAEVVTLTPLIKRLGAKLVAMTGKPDSTLASRSDVHLDVSVEKEACPLNLAPTASTTATLAMGDAIAVALLQARGFTEQDFAFSHPGGSLGKKLLLTVDDIMHKGAKIPVVNDSDSLFTALEEMSAKGLGMTTVVDAQGQLVGLFTDGDIRRHLDKPLNIHQTPISDVMTQGGLTIKSNALAAEALQLMETRKINGLIVVDEQQRPIGVFNMHDLLRAGIL